MNFFKQGRKSSASGLFLSFVGSPYPYLLVGGILASFLFCSVLSGVIASLIMEDQMALADVVARRSTSPFVSSNLQSSTGTDIKFAAFNVPEINPASVDKKAESAAKPIDAFTLVGTLPSVGAWINVDSATTLVLRKQEFNGYVLEVIERGEVLFTRDGDSFPIFLNLSSPGASAQTPAQPATAQPAATVPVSAPVSPATINGNDGTIARELLNDLLANPMSEIGKMRLVPEGDGMRVRSIRPDSMLAQLGVAQGDLLTGINGIAINTGPDFLNVLKTLLDGSRFDVSVTRGQDAGKLGYVVR
jgi:type II secretory pathway component PulC